MIKTKNKWVRRTGKGLIWLVGIYIGLLVLLSLILLGYRQALVKKVMKEVDEKVQGKVLIGDIDVSVWRYFPRVGVEVKDVRIIDSVYKKPFLKAGLVAIRMGFWEIFGDDLDVQRISIKDVLVNSFTDSTGYTNAYVLRPAKQQLPAKENPEKARKNLLLKEVLIENVHFIARHDVKEKNINVTLRKGTLLINDVSDEEWKISFAQDVFITRLGFNMARGAWLKNKPLQATWSASYFPKQSKIIINETKTLINKHPYNISGVFNLADSGFFSLKVATEQLSFAEGRSLLADNVERKLKVVELAQLLAVDALIEGTLAYKGDPKVRVNWVAPPGRIKTPVVTLDSVQFYGHYFNERIPGMGRKDDNSELVLQKMTAKWGPVILYGDSVVMTNLKDPNLQFRFTSGVELSRLDEALNLNTLRIDGGQANLEMKYNGPLLTNADALGKVTATLQVHDGMATYLPRNLNFKNVQGTIVLSENLLLLDKVKTSINGNLIEVNLKGTQIGSFVGGAGTGPSKSFITLDVYSPSLNMNSMAALLAKRQGARKAKQPRMNYPLKQIDEILENGTVALNLRIKELLQNKLKATNISGQAIFMQEDLLLQKLQMNAAGGTMLLNAELKRRPDNNLNATLDARVTKVNVKQFFYGLDNFGQTGITHENLEGIFTNRTQVKAVITPGGKLVPQSVDGKIDFTLQDGALVNHQGIQNIKKFVFKKRDLGNIRFAKVANVLTIRNDTVYVPRMEVYSSALLMFIEGKYGLGGGTDLSVQLPLSNLKNKEDEFNEEENIGTDAKLGPSVWFRARQKDNGEFKFGLDAFKKLRKKEEMPAGIVPVDQPQPKAAKAGVDSTATPPRKS